MISIDWSQRIINVPRADLTLQTAFSSGFSTGFSSGFGTFGTRYTYDLEAFRIELRDEEDSVDGMNYPPTHNRNAPVLLSGTTYAQVLQIINGYTVTFEAGNYAVTLSGANHNIGDVQNVNGVSLILGLSTGLIVVTQGSGVLDNKKYAAFLEALDAPPQPNEALNKLLHAQAPWE